MGLKPDRWNRKMATEPRMIEHRCATIVLFFETSYADKKGKYQKQKTIVLPKL